MLRSLRFAALFCGLILSASALAVDIDAASYGYPLTNPFEATIATTPPDLRPELPLDDDINQRDETITLRPETRLRTARQLLGREEADLPHRYAR